MVVIIDDREDVWNYAPNLIHVRPYHFFQHTGDINAPPGLTKKEADDKEGFDFSSLTTMGDSGSVRTYENAVESTRLGIKQKTSEGENSGGSEQKVEVSESEKVEAKSSSSSDPSHPGERLDEDKSETTTISSGESNVVVLEDVVEGNVREETPKSERNDLEVTPAQESPVCDTTKGESNPQDQVNIHIQDTDDYLLHLEVKMFYGEASENTYYNVGIS